MRFSDQINELAKAMAGAQASFRHAEKNSTNPHLKSKYADLSAVIDAVREPLSKAGIAYVQLPSVENNVVTVTTRLLHESGQWAEAQLSLVVHKTDIQSMGAAITYGRRYSLAAMLGIASDEEDDAVAAMPPAERKQDFRKIDAAPAKPAPKIDAAPAKPVSKPAQAPAEGVTPEEKDRVWKRFKQLYGDEASAKLQKLFPAMMSGRVTKGDLAAVEAHCAQQMDALAAEVPF
jgi:hypothetical protein